MAILAYCSTAARTTTAPDVAAIAAARPSPAPAVHAHAAVLRQLVDEVLLLPGLRQSLLRAQLLQLRDGLHTIARVQDRTTLHCATAQIDRSGGRSKTDGPLNGRHGAISVSSSLLAVTHLPAQVDGLRRAGCGGGTDEGKPYRGVVSSAGTREA